jgi:transcriptional regulator
MSILEGRNQVISMRARGMNQTAIARELQVSEASISLDIQFLKEQSLKVIKQYTTHDLSLQYQVTLNALDSIIERAFEISETTHDNREKMQTMQLFKDTHMTKLELLSNSTTIDSALHYIRSKQSQQEQQQKKHLADDYDSDSDSQITMTDTAAGK